MQSPKKIIKVEKIDTKTMYKMVQSLLNNDWYYEVKCLVNVFIEKRADKSELEILNEIKDLLYEYKLEEVKKILEKQI